MTLISRGFVVFTLLLSVGCASIQAPVAVEEGLYQDTQKMLVVMEPVPEATTYFPGASCLLCIATAEAMHQTLGDHAETLDEAEFKLSKSQLATKLREKGLDVVVLDEPVVVKDLPKASASGDNMPKRDFSGLAKEHGASHVMVISVELVGISRAFASYIPTEEPVARIKGVGYLVDVRDGTYDWYQPFDVAKGVEGEWDQPPDFPKLTNAFYQVLAQARDELIAYF